VTAIYLYCIVKAATKPAAARISPGVPGASRPEVFRVSPSLWLVAADVPLDTYGAGNLERHLSDMDWIGQVALSHEAVVEHFSRKAGATVVPMKLFTMFSTRERAVADIAARKQAIAASMRRIAGAEEWGIRVLRGDKGPPAPSSPQAATGAAFLAARKQARDAARDAKLAAAEAAAQAFERLSKLAKDSRRRDDPPPAGTTVPLLDAAFLVSSGRRARFTQTARREAAACARAGARMTLSGPWPAYNFIQGESS
jgi:hypothetical protein